MKELRKFQNDSRTKIRKRVGLLGMESVPSDPDPFHRKVFPGYRPQSSL